jgi:NitT/TauT family transport system ATP-binding protein
MGLDCRNLSKTYGGGDAAVPALDDVTFRLGDREIACLVGPSGCGKSTLLRIIAGLLPADSGACAMDGAAANGRPRNALVFQEQGLFPWMTVRQNVAFGLRMAGERRRRSASRAEEAIARMGLAAFARRYPHELSVGMRQRVNLARAFLVDPRILLMDEPFASLDAQTRLVLQEELLASCERSHKAVLYVTHDIEEAVLMGDRVLVMSGRPGRIRDDIAVPLPRPRDLAVRGDPEVAALVERIWGQLEGEVRRSLGAGAS